jgi:Fe-S cluster biogenesis protein NfuA
MQPTTESNLVTFETGDRVRTDTGEEGRFVVVSFDGKSAFVQLDGSGPCSTFPISSVTQLSRVDGAS